MDYLINFFKSIAIAVAIGVTSYIVLKMVFMAFVHIYRYLKK